MISARQRPFPLFVLGALLYAAAVALFMPRVGDEHLFTLLELLVPLFGLPYLLLGGRFAWPWALYLLLLVPGAHYLAVVASIQSTNWTGSGFQPGAVGGLVGSVLALASLAALRLARPRSAAIMAAGVAGLALLGGLGVWKMDLFAGTALDDYGLLLTLYLPWQIAFGWLLSRVLRAPAQIDLAAAPAPA